MTIMNLPAHPLLRRWLTLGATLAGCLAIVRAASVGPSGYANDFSTQPSAADWSFLNVAGAGTDITTAAGMDAAVELLTAGGITSQAVADTGNPPALNDWIGISKPKG